MTNRAVLPNHSRLFVIFMKTETCVWSLIDGKPQLNVKCDWVHVLIDQTDGV